MKKSILATFAVLVFAGLFSQNAHSAEKVFGPYVFTREVGGPETSEASFAACDPDGSFRLVVENGGGSKKTTVSSASISVNGVPVVGQSDFNMNAARIERPISYIGDENVISVRLASSPGGYVTVYVIAEMSCLEVHIDSPPDGTVTGDIAPMVTGSIESEPGTEVGVTVNGFAAEVNGSAFAFPAMLQEGENVLTVVATDADGSTATDSVTVTLADPVQPVVYLSATPVSGPPPLEVTFDANAMIGGISHCELRLDGTGEVLASAQSTEALLSAYAHTFTSVGLYFPRLTVTDEAGNEFSSLILINAVEPPRLAEKWDGMRTALAAGDVGKATSFLSIRSRGSYNKNLSVLAEKEPSALQEMADEMANMNIYKQGGDYALGQFIVNENGTEVSFPVQFIKDEDGIWRIESF